VNQRGNSGGRTALLAAGLVLGLALVGLAAGEQWRGGEGRGDGPVPVYVVDAMLVLGAILGAVTMVLFALVYGGAYGSVGLERRKHSSTMRVLTSVTIVIVAIFAVVAIRKAWADRFGNDRQAEAAQIEAGERAEAERRSDDRTLDWRFVGGAFVVALAGSAYAARLLLRNAHEPGLPDDPAEAVAAILDDTLEDLRDEQDPRRAVVAAYARMERALAAHGLPRHRSEAPAEYLERTLEELSASASSASRLTRLFEWARFSDHPVEPDMKEEAIRALEAVRDELTAPLVTV
jgi:Domain of unknown function (DUF4129)